MDAMPQPTSVDDSLEVAKITVKQKWQGAVTDGSGFVAVPMALLRLQSRYELTPTELLVLINLLGHWWDPDRPVYPRSTTIAKRMGIDTRTVQRATKELETKGLLQRAKMADGRRIFRFDALAKKLSRDINLAYQVHSEERYGA